MHRQLPQWKQVDVRIEVTSFGTGHWTIDLTIAHLVEKRRASIPVCSGGAGEPMSHTQWVDLLEMVKVALATAITEVCETT